ncbi:MAG: OsmC family protein [Mucilaginibacter sp.]|nr:OsmC family protein [Mucilaginibacter sp.]
MLRPLFELNMNSLELKNLQSPLKEKYTAEPTSALITLKAQGNVGEGISCKVDTGRALVEAGLHPATGGDGMLACSGDMLLEALVACAGVTLKAVATAIGVEIKSGIIKAEGDLDFRGTLGVSKEASVGFKQIRLSFHLDSDATAEQMASLSKLTERYCVIYQTICAGTKIETSYSID